MFDYKKCPQDTDLYCPHYKDACDAAKEAGIRCVHIEASMQAMLAVTAMRAMVRNSVQEPIVTEAIKRRLESMGIITEWKKIP